VVFVVKHWEIRAVLEVNCYCTGTTHTGMAPPTSSALTAPNATTPTLSLQVQSVDDLARLARVFAASGLFGRNGNQETQVAECAIRLMAGMEAGFSPFASATGVHIIEGKPAFSSNLLAQAVRRHPVYDYQVLENTATTCRIQFTANGKPMGVSEFTIEMARRAGLADKSIWKKYPESMLFSRALTAGIRTHCPDALGGHTAYTPEELGGGDVVPVTVVEAPPAPAPAAEPTAELIASAYAACADAGLSDDGLMALIGEISNGAASTLDQLPKATLERLASAGVSAETVARCNGAEDPGDLPAAWAA
jgi:hypothetical protein